jgi:glycosyltransferase involved in cell wall biosynthesis
MVTAASRSGRPLRVCHVAYTFYESDNRVRRYAEALADRGDQVDVIALRRPRQPRRGNARGVAVFRIQRRAVNEKSASSYLAKILWFFLQSAVLLSVLQVRRRYDVIHVHNVPDFLVFVTVLPKIMGARVILDIHDIVPELYAGKFGSANNSLAFRSLLAVERLSCRFADHVIVANDLWHAKLVARAVREHKCTTILNYPDLTLFKPLEAKAECAEKRFVILYPGTLNQHQGLDVAIKAFALVKDRMPEAEFQIFGEGPAHSNLVRLTRDLGLADRVHIFARVSLEQIASIMASADVGVVPKRADGFGNEAFSTKILEFMACGVPVIVSRTRIDEHYFDEKLVRFFVPGDEVDLANVLLEVYERRLLHADWIRTARDFAVRNSWQEKVSSYRGLIEGLISPAVAHGS